MKTIRGIIVFILIFGALYLVGPRVENPELYVSKFNWLENWYKLYFFTKVSDNLLVLATISLITFLLFYYKNQKKIKNRSKIFIILHSYICFIC